MAQRTALLLGSTGLIGGHLKNTLLQAPEYTKIRLLVRRPQASPHPKIEVHVVDFDQLEKYSELFQVDDVFCCLGTTMKRAGSKEAFRKVDYEYPKKAAELAKKQKVRQYLLVSALGADPKASVFYNRVKGEIENEIKRIGFPAIHIFRPSLLLGNRAEKRFGEKVGIIAYNLTSWMWVGPLKPYRGIQAKTVATALYRQAIQNKKGIHILPSIKIEDLGK